MVDIPADELTAAAKRLRRAARLLQAVNDEEEMALATWLLDFADRCLDIATGLKPPPHGQSQMAYDRDTGSDYVEIPVNVGD